MNKEIEYIKERAQGIAKYSDKLRQSIKDIDTEMTPHFKDAGIIVFDDEFKYEDEYDIYKLGIFKARYGEYAGMWGIFLEGHNGEESWIGDASRKALVQATSRIIPLLEKYSRVLAQKELEYKAIAEKAEAMAGAITGL